MVCTESTKHYLISRVPAVLILHLKRFQVQKYRFCKVGKQVTFPMLLDLAPVSKDYTKRRIYALYGVVEHSGTLYGGHYVAYVKVRCMLWNFDNNETLAANCKIISSVNLVEGPAETK